LERVVDRQPASASTRPFGATRGQREGTKPTGSGHFLYNLPLRPDRSSREIARTSAVDPVRDHREHQFKEGFLGTASSLQVPASTPDITRPRIRAAIGAAFALDTAPTPIPYSRDSDNGEREIESM
jgi:hypothetical protein